jgi:hypothetical protein
MEADRRVSQREKLIAKMRASPQSIRFEEVLALAKHLELEWRIDGSHYYFTHPAHPYPIMVQRPHAGKSTVKPAYIRSLMDASLDFGHREWGIPYNQTIRGEHRAGSTIQ